jgi:hypothetical protein
LSAAFVERAIARIVEVENEPKRRKIEGQLPRERTVGRMISAKLVERAFDRSYE